MASSVPDVVYVDELPDELSIQSTRLNKVGTLHVTGVSPPKNLDVSEILSLNPAVVVIDYELTKQPPGAESHVSYMGGSLATRIREVAPNIAIAVLTRRSLLRQYATLRRFPDSIDQLGAVDAMLYKEDLRENPLAVTRTLLGLVEGYAGLRSESNRDWQSLRRLLGADDDEAELLQEVAPPLTTESEASTPSWDVPGTARWILRILMRYPGILYNPLEAATFLGLDVRALEFDLVKDTIMPAKYEGPFSSLSHFWWRPKLAKIAHRVLKEAGISPPIAEHFGPILAGSGAPIPPAVCVWSNSEYADTVCYLLSKPVRREYSLAYFPDNRPQVMDQARVSYRAIVESLEFDDSLLTEEGRLVAASVKKEVRSRTLPNTP